MVLYLDPIDPHPTLTPHSQVYQIQRWNNSSMTRWKPSGEQSKRTRIGEVKCVIIFLSFGALLVTGSPDRTDHRDIL